MLNHQENIIKIVHIILIIDIILISINKATMHII